MRITYRWETNKSYWERRWADIDIDTPMLNISVYPLRYAEAMITDKSAPILEAGCGAGRVLRYYHDKGYDIQGFDFIESVIGKLREADKTLRVRVENVTRMSYSNESFQYVLAFGIYHNIENGIDDALSETRRVLKPGGHVCASFRADNMQNRIIDWIAAKKNAGRMQEECRKNAGRMQEECRKNAGRMQEECRKNAGRIS